MPVQTIAIVNSDPILLSLLQELLLEEGYAATTYLTTDQTHYQLRTTQPNLIILDVGLQASAPGWPLLKLIRFDPHTVGIPVLVSTVDHLFIESKRAYLESVGCGVLELPASFADLIAKVVQLIGPLPLGTPKSIMLPQTAFDSEAVDNVPLS